MFALRAIEIRGCVVLASATPTRPIKAWVAMRLPAQVFRERTGVSALVFRANARNTFSW